MPEKQTLIELNRQALLQHTTVAKLLNEEQERMCDIFKNKNLSADHKNKIERYADKLTEHRLTGVAKCSPEDEFDLETGKRIARARLLKRYYKKKEKVCLKVDGFAYQLTMFAWSMENYCADAYYEYLEEERV